MAKRLTLQIDRPCFKDILNGVQTVEHRYIYPSNAKRYVTQNETAEGLDVQPIQYDELLLINGRRKDAPRLVVSVKRASFVVFTDENGNDLTFVEKGEEWLVCQVWYYLGEVLSSENCPRDFFYSPDMKAQRLAELGEIEAEMERRTDIVPPEVIEQ
jgi:hypothetical protein